MDSQEHVIRHRELHAHLDELVADFILHTNKFLSETKITELVTWSYEQTKKATEVPK